jgi:hypothetical protein
MMMRYLLSAVALCAAVPAAAQEAPERVTERINQVIVYGDDACPPAPEGSDDIVVCARLDEGERYRIPEALRGDPNNPVRESWTARVRSLERIGRTGTDSCSPVGLGGFTGCFNQLIDQSVAERAQAAGTDWTVAVAEARRERMEGFNAASDEVEAQIARDEAARIARETAAEAEAEGVDAEPLPAPVSGDGPGR